MRTPRKQQSGNIAHWVNIQNFTLTSGTSVVITPALATALNTAGENEFGAVAPVPDVISASKIASGIIASGVSNTCQLFDATTKQKLKDASNNEVYGRITDAAGVRTVSYYSLVAGVETAYTLPADTAADVLVPYRFPWNLFPTDTFLTIGGTYINDDPTATFTRQQQTTERLTIATANTIPALTLLPDVTTNVELIINGVSYFSFGGAGVAAFDVVGQNITWNPTNTESGFNVQPSDFVVAKYTYQI